MSDRKLSSYGFAKPPGCLRSVIDFVNAVETFSHSFQYSCTNNATGAGLFGRNHRTRVQVRDRDPIVLRAVSRSVRVYDEGEFHVLDSGRTA